MDTRHASGWKTQDLFLVLVSLFVLLPCLYYPYRSASSPEIGFTLSSTDWKVVTAYPCKNAPDSCLQVGDQVLSVQGIDFRHFVRDRRLSIPDLFHPHGVARIQLVRNGQPLSRDVRVHAEQVEVPQILFSVLAPLIFWLMGTVVIIFLRPRDERWLVLILFSYVTALWIASGFAARRVIVSTRRSASAS